MLIRLLLSFMTMISLSFSMSKDTIYYQSGEVNFIISLNEKGEKHGKGTKFYKDGKDKCHNNYLHDKKHGLQTCLHPNGNKSDSVTYEQGFAKGWWKKWDENGNPKVEHFYKHQKVLENKYYFKNSNLLKQKIRYEFINDKSFKVMLNSYNKNGKIISQIRNGSGVDKLTDIKKQKT